MRKRLACAAIMAIGYFGAASPLAAAGHPDFSGVWQSQTMAAFGLEEHRGTFGIVAGKSVVEGGELPYQPWAAAKVKNNLENIKEDPEAHCYLSGVPRILYAPFSFRILQTGAYIAMFFEFNHEYRIIPMDGRPHLQGVSMWMGDSRGRWDGDTLVVDVTGFNDKTWFDMAGNFHSGALHVVERYTLAGPDTIAYQATVDDPKVFTRPWKMNFRIERHKEKNFELLEYACYEGERDLRHYPAGASLEQYYRK